ncbi:Hypothetical protein PAB0741 [Pyrococcus abyssi GE5]|uniref:Uncharacterized protein n=1 Tax=Pyrococcus abyssi (strain GE5 / Orsay) TaxID=272844 RepID=Q9UZM9_PYRAB|nr:Hypothetical protein PAB0741 [Pyrococcus abyssi GE5]
MIAWIYQIRVFGLIVLLLSFSPGSFIFVLDLYKKCSITGFHEGELYKPREHSNSENKQKFQGFPYNLSPTASLTSVSVELSSVERSRCSQSLLSLQRFKLNLIV